MPFRRRVIHPLLPPGKAHLIPVEIISDIFLLVVQGQAKYRKDLILVCRRWHAIRLSTPGIPSTPLRIRKSTRVEVVQAAIQGRWWLLYVTVDTDDETYGKDFNADEFHACFMAAAQAASRWWCSLDLYSFPPPEEYKVLQIVQPLECLESFELDTYSTPSGLLGSV